MQNRITATPFVQRARIRRLAASALIPALLLGGCGSSSNEAALEARIAAAEAKAEAADKRSQQALSLAVSGNSSQSSGTNGEVEVFEGDPVVDDSGFSDNSGDAPSYDSQMESPASPPIMPGA